MRIWHVSSNRWNSAITEYALSAARSLASRGHETLFSPLTGSPAERRARELGLTTAPLDSFGLGGLTTARRHAKGFAPDRILVYAGPETALAMSCVGAAKGAKVVRFRGHEPPAPGPLASARQRLSHVHVALMLTPSNHLAQALRELMPKQRVEAVTLGCDAQRFARKPGARSGKVAEAVILGRFDPVKGHDAAFSLFAKAKAAGNTAMRLSVVGEAANLDVTALGRQALAHGLVLDTDVRFTPKRVEDVATMLSSAAIGWIPSVGSELICRVAEEFMLCGVPVVVSGTGSLDETILTKDDGASYRGLADDDAARLMARWLERGAAEDEAAREARETRARAAFSLEAMGARLEELLAGI